MLKELVELVVKKIVNDPNAVVVTETMLEEAIVIKLAVASEDIGKVIGKEGRMARAIRTLVHAAALKEGKRAVLEILD
jgi:predicted RNA-binding protein YlqC (UPF0109 family)